MKEKLFLGCKKSPFDSQDILMRSFLKPIALPESFDLTDSMTRVRSQGREGSCVGFAMAVGVKEWQEQKDYDRFIELSPRYIYEEAKKISGHSEGTTLKAAMQVVRTKGVCEEKFWPYRVPQLMPKNALADDNAAKYKIKTYARITNVEELIRSLIQFGPILIGVRVYKGMKSDQARDTGIVPNPSCWDRMSPLGGHAICLGAFMNRSPYWSNDGHIKCKNSWDEDYGDKGYIYLSYKYIKANMLDAFSCVDILDPNPYRVVDLLASGKREKAWL